MRIIADLHIHSKYARACSKELTPQNLDLWARKKGIAVLGTGDFTHPLWMEELSNSLEEVKPGLYQLKTAISKSDSTPTLFMYTAEIASIYKQGDKVRRVHNLVFAPNVLIAKKFNQALESCGANLKSDGRPIMGIHCDDLVKIAKDVDPCCEVIPAHAWTPHFGVFGSLSGFDSLTEAFGDQAQHIFAIETGLSSDPIMNRRVPGLDTISLISNSDPHSLHRLGREANIFDINPDALSYAEIIRVIRNRDPKEFLGTIEFFPEEGRYHLDGHRDCLFSCLPAETKSLGGVCPVCGKQLLRGVLSRVEDLSRVSNIPPHNTNFVSVIPLEEVIADVLGVGVSSKKVPTMYEHMVERGSSEFDILLDLAESDISRLGSPAIAAAILRVRQGLVNITPGYDGLYGKVSIYTKAERVWLEKKPTQLGLF